MKKLLLVFAILLAVGCSKDEKVVQEKSLAGTEWSRNGWRSGEVRFTKSECELKWWFHDMLGGIRTHKYSYVYNHPDIAFKPISEDARVLKGKVDGNRMEIRDEKGSEFLILYKN